MSKMRPPDNKINVALIMCSHRGPNNLDTFSSFMRQTSSVPANFTMALITASEAGIAKSRSYWASMFVRDPKLEKYQVLAFIDDDMVFEPKDFFDICRHAYEDKCVYSGVYVKREFPTTAIVSVDDGVFRFDGSVREVNGVGTGFIAIHRDVIAAVAATLELVDSGKKDENGEPFYIYPIFGEIFVDKGGPVKTWLSEDYSFCWLVKQAGYKVMADSSIFLEHCGPYKYSAKDLLKSEKQEKKV